MSVSDSIADMIDPETQKKIIELKERGYSNNEIKRKTGVSLPSIRRILREAGVDGGKSKPRRDEDSISELDERVSELEKEVEELREQLTSSGSNMRTVRRFLINFTKNMPFTRSKTYLEALESGVAPWKYTEYLPRVCPPESVAVIEEQINNHLPVQGKIFAVEIRQDLAGEIIVEVKQIYSAYRLH